MAWLVPAILMFSLRAVETVNILANPGSLVGAVKGTRPVFCRERIANVPVGERKAVFRAVRIRRDSTYHSEVPYSGFELKTRVAKTSFRQTVPLMRDYEAGIIDVFPSRLVAIGWCRGSTSLLSLAAFPPAC